jgi:N-acyl-D-amino-acid deacylase
MDEVNTIARETGAPVHISHFNMRAERVLPRVDQDIAEGIDLTFDLYPYLAGSSILAMVALPPWVQEGGNDATLARLRDSSVREKLRDWFKEPKYAHADLKLSAIAAPQFRHLEGKMLPDAAAAAGLTTGDLICELLIASNLAAGIVHFHRARTDSDIHASMRHAAHMAGSDGIFVGGSPHPRGWGSYARYVGRYVRDERLWSVEDAVRHCSSRAADRFGLRDRGFIRTGMAADIVCFDPSRLIDQSTYENGRALADGVEHVLVNGQFVLRAGQRTPATPGRGLRRA